MEWVAVVLSGLFAAISPANLILDDEIEQAVRSQVTAVEQLEVRVDNAPSYQVVGGKVERVRIASRGLQPISALRFEVLELEAESIDIDLARLQQDPLSERWLNQALQSGIRLVLTEADLNRALQSRQVQSRLQQLLDRSVPPSLFGGGRYKLLTSRLQLNHQRVQFQGQLESTNSQGRSLDVSLETGINVVAGQRLELIDPQGTINGRQLSRRLLQSVAQVLSRRLDLRQLEPSGLTARLLQLEIEDEQIRLAAFIDVEPDYSF